MVLAKLSRATQPLDWKRFVAAFVSLFKDSIVVFAFNTLLMAFIISTSESTRVEKVVGMRDRSDAGIDELIS